MLKNNFRVQVPFNFRKCNNSSSIISLGEDLYNRNPNKEPSVSHSDWCLSQHWVLSENSASSCSHKFVHICNFAEITFCVPLYLCHKQWKAKSTKVFSKEKLTLE